MRGALIGAGVVAVAALAVGLRSQRTRAAAPAPPAPAPPAPAPPAPKTPVRALREPIVFAAYDEKTGDRPFCLDVFRMNADGSGFKNLTRSPDAECDPVLSPDGQRIAFAVLLPETGLYTMRADGSDRRRVTAPGSVACGPSWSPDGKQLAFTAVTWKPGESGRMTYSVHVQVIPAGGGTPRGLAEGFSPSWSPVSDEILFTDLSGSLRGMPAGGGRSRVVVPAKGEESVTGAWSPDGRQIACILKYGSQFLVDADGSHRKPLPAGAPMCAPQWSPDGKWLFYSRMGTTEDSISELWRVGLDGKKPKGMVRGKAMSGSFGFHMVGFLGIGSEEAAKRQPPQGPTVAGPEAPEVLAGLQGWLVTGDGSAGLDAISLPDLKRRPVVATTGAGTDDEGSIYYHTGPDAEGRIVYVEDFMADPPAKSHFTLNVVRLDGSGRRVLFSRAGDALWDDAIGEHLALSPGDGRVACLLQPKRAQMPGALLETGVIELCDVETGALRSLGVRALDDGLSWFPDGQRLAYSALVPREGKGALPLAPDGFGKEFAEWPSIPTVFILDTKNGRSRVLHPGWNPVVSADGTQVGVADMGCRFRQVDAATGRSTPLSLPGSWGELLALPGPKHALYWALPTRGRKQEWTESNSPLVGPKQKVTIKVADPGTGRFATLLPAVDPRSKVSYGPPARK